MDRFASSTPPLSPAERSAVDRALDALRLMSSALPSGGPTSMQSCLGEIIAAGASGDPDRTAEAWRTARLLVVSTPASVFNQIVDRGDAEAIAWLAFAEACRRQEQEDE